MTPKFFENLDARKTAALALVAALAAALAWVANRPSEDVENQPVVTIERHRHSPVAEGAQSLGAGVGLPRATDDETH